MCQTPLKVLKKVLGGNILTCSWVTWFKFPFFLKFFKILIYLAAGSLSCCMWYLVLRPGMEHGWATCTEAPSLLSTGPPGKSPGFHSYFGGKKEDWSYFSTAVLPLDWLDSYLCDKFNLRYLKLSNKVEKNNMKRTRARILTWFVSWKSAPCLQIFEYHKFSSLR